jgi:hypothetical protein
MTMHLQVSDIWCLQKRINFFEKSTLKTAQNKFYGAIGLLKRFERLPFISSLDEDLNNGQVI